jgi:hypothetical protein
MINYNKIAEEIKKNKFNQSLKTIQDSVERILYNNKYTAKKFIDKRLDNYCLKIGKSNTQKKKTKKQKSK